MRVAVVTHSSTFEPRAHAVGRYFLGRGDEVTWVFSDFDHIAKRTVERNEPDHAYVHMAPFTRNLSLRRMRSIHRFAADAGETLEALEEKGAFDLLWVMVPANSLAPMADDFHRRHGTPVMFDIIDLWPESLPVRGVGWTLPARLWRGLRDKHLGCARLVFVECDRYREALRLPASGSCTLYWYKEDDAGRARAATGAPLPGFAPGVTWRNLGEGALPVAYLGSINNIIDIALIRRLLSAMNARTPIHLHIIGQGERRGEFAEAMRGAVAQVTDHGAIYDEAEKNQILGGCCYGINIMKPTVTVGLTMKSIDYLYCGLPLLNTIGGDTHRMVEGEGIGVNVDRDDVDASAEFAVNAALDATQAASMHADARQCYEEHFTQASFRSTLDQALLGILGAPGA